MDDLSGIQAKLKQAKSKLTSKYHIKTIGLFGSVVRHDFDATSDIDILIDFSKPIGMEIMDLYYNKVLAIMLRFPRSAPLLSCHRGNVLCLI